MHDWECPQCGYDIEAHSLCFTCQQHKDLTDANARIAELEAQKRQLVMKCIHAAGESIKNYELAKDNLDLAESISTKLAAAEATLARLREVVPEDENADDWCGACHKFIRGNYAGEGEIYCSICKSNIWDSSADTLRAILYPKEDK